MTNDEADEAPIRTFTDADYDDALEAELNYEAVENLDELLLFHGKTPVEFIQEVERLRDRLAHEEIAERAELIDRLVQLNPNQGSKK